MTDWFSADANRRVDDSGRTRLATRAIESRYRRLARRAGSRSPRGGSVTVHQRFGSDLRLNLLHGLFLDGAYGDDLRGRRRFFTAPAPSPNEVEQLLGRILGGARTLLSSAEEDVADEELALLQTCAASAGTQGSERCGPGEEPGLGLVVLPTRRKARIDGWDLDAEVAVHEHEHEERPSPHLAGSLRQLFALDAGGSARKTRQKRIRPKSAFLRTSPARFASSSPSMPA